jgi:hypothetical protein
MNISNLYDRVMGYADQMSPQEWVVALVVMLVVGALCLKGFGSRSNY